MARQDMPQSLDANTSFVMRPMDYPTTLQKHCYLGRLARALRRSDMSCGKTACLREPGTTPPRNLSLSMHTKDGST